MPSPEFVAIRIDGQEWGLDLSCLREIVPYEAPIAVPQAPKYLQGVINLRGEIVPVIDLPLLLGRHPAPATKRSCILIAEAVLKGECTLLGVVADLVDGMGKTEDTAVELLDFAKLIPA